MSTAAHSTAPGPEPGGATSIRVDEPGFADKVRKRMERLTPNRHNAMPRFRNNMLVLLVSGLVILLGATTSAFRHSHALVGDTASYSTQFTTSKTNQSGEVSGVYANADHTRAMVLMKFDDITKVSTDAKQYQAWIAGSTPKGDYAHLKSRPSGAVYVFGSTGYIGVYLTDAVGFPNQVVSLSMRAHTELVAPGDNGIGGTSNTFGDDTFKKYDQWRIWINPGAKATQHADELDQAQPDLQKLYDEMVVQPVESQTRTQLDTDLTKMKSDLAAISEYTKRLQTMNVNGKHLVMVPAPVQVRSDKVTGTDGNLVLRTSHVVPGGYDFDWRGGTVQQGYLSKVVPPGAQWDSYLSSQASKAQSATGLETDSDQNWALSDGTLLSDYSQSAVNPYQTMSDTITLLEQAYQNYYTDKQNYEVTDLSQLLSLEVGLKDVQENNTINSGADVIRLY